MSESRQSEVVRLCKTTPPMVAEYESSGGRFFVFGCYRDSLRRNGGSVRIRGAYDVRDSLTGAATSVCNLREAREWIATQMAVQR